MSAVCNVCRLHAAKIMQVFCPFSFLWFTFPQTPFKALLHIGSIFNPNASHIFFFTWVFILASNNNNPFSFFYFFLKYLFSFLLPLLFFFSSNKLHFSRMFFVSIEPCGCVTWTTLLKGYLCYKMITTQNVSSEAQIKDFFIL